MKQWLFTIKRRKYLFDSIENACKKVSLKLGFKALRINNYEGNLQEREDRIRRHLSI